MHVNQGNVGLADGSVQQYSNAGLREALQNSGDADQHLADCAAGIEPAAAFRSYFYFEIPGVSRQNPRSLWIAEFRNPRFRNPHLT